MLSMLVVVPHCPLFLLMLVLCTMLLNVRYAATMPLVEYSRTGCILCLAASFAMN